MKNELTTEQLRANLEEFNAWDTAWSNRSRVSFDRARTLPVHVNFWDEDVRGTVAGHTFRARFESRGGSRNPMFGFVLAVDGNDLGELVGGHRFCSLSAAKDDFRLELFRLTEWADLRNS